MTMSTNIGTVNSHKRQLDLSILAGLLEQQLNNLLQDTMFLIISESMINAPIWRIVTWQVPPGSAGTQDPEDAVKHLPDLCGLPPACRLVGDKRLNGLELIISEGVPSHAISPVKGLKIAVSVKVEPRAEN